MSVGCLSPSDPSSVPLVDIVGRATLPSGAPAAGLTISSLIYEPDNCGLTPIVPTAGPTATTIADANGAFRLRAPADSPGRQCVSVGTRVPGGGASATVIQIAEARTRPPFTVIEVNLALR